MTKIWKITEADLTDKSKQTKLEKQLEEIKIAFTYGEIIGIPTETVYGLAADARNSEAINKIFSAKGRPGDNPLIIHIHDISQLEDFTAALDERVIKLMEVFWPGPISFILPLTGDYLSSNAVAELDSVAVRMPSHPVGRKILQYADIPLAAPSANISGKPSPTNAQHVIDDLEDRLYGVVDSESAIYGIESTVLDCTQFPYRIARPGAVTKEQLEEVLESVVDTVNDQMDKPISPGMKYKHYAPSQPLIVIEGGINNNTKLPVERTQKVGIIAPETSREFIGEDIQFISLCRDRDSYKEAARNLYSALRVMDTSDVDIIFIHGFDKVPESAGLMNRIYKATGNEVIQGG
ncbi:threonylcarbamoyl-AMP synthase [Jeotgalicoccus coquinae]|uniref:Threonylcarbamoyl-AMP synthase n=1 Tax=Jeotgalicoccus coquinae TaxID=709509 RepID=A0A6V7RNN5_9STAP|nr:L-threonylcarbamoyladenylate synthase [Jeotgalicoccus coquinae]MBB6424033.1 L-threonylcarbamoyladenylate synthase [Jeotgalicoccus coquinae]GGE23022.1 threonylcarbamoyl-AMP synthase [Jeotgalicoccus coquinae]CAD2080027.1 Threonylcarbamoyl-AMP synthase [Jeotgalicoccus coquinae]